MSGIRGTALALAGGAIALVLTAWFDSVLVANTLQNTAATSDMGRNGLMLALDSVVAVGAVLLLAALAWRSRSILVGAAYTVVGAYFALQTWVLWTFASRVNDTPPVLPALLTRAVSDLYRWTEGGPVHAIGTVGAGMLIAGIAVLAMRLRPRTASPAQR